MRKIMLLLLLAAHSPRSFAGGSSEVVFFQDNFNGAISSTWQIQSNNSSLYSVGANGVTVHCCYYDMWPPSNGNYYNLFLITNPAPQDFILTLKCQWITPPTKDWGQIALVAYDSDTNYVRVDNLSNNSGAKYFELLEAVSGTNPHDEACIKNFGTSAFWLQMRKQQTNYSSWFSTDGINFTQTNAPIIYTNGPSAKLGFVAMADTNQTGVVLVSSFTVAVPSPGSLSLQLNSGSAGLQVTGTVGATYQVQFTTNLASVNWITLTNFVLPSSPYPYLDSTPVQNKAAGFYRAVLIP